MSCQDFKRVVEELADGRLMEAAARDAGLSHAAVCVECAARLMEARGIGAGLKVAARAETEEAPARVREALLAAFAERHGIVRQEHEDAPPSNVVALPSRRAARIWFAAGAAAAVAVILLSLTLNSLVRLSPDGSRSKPQEVSEARPLPAQAPVEVKVEKPGILVGSNIARTTSLKKRPRATKAAHSLKSETRGGSAAVARSNSNDYLPLTYLADATAMESGTVVRVELSRSALISLGVPVEPTRADETLKADVVLGDDGVARAIRLVQD
ncbi:MAG TPA: hypothetical protein VF297_08270 [Pyrinomonadaceae bacterium]